MKILLVDDDADMITILGTILRTEGFEVEEAENGMEAVEKMKTMIPDMIVTDVMMPKMNGWELCHKVRETADVKHVPILALTAKSTQIDEMMAYECGASEYLPKPFENSVFLEKVRRLSAKPAPHEI